MSPRLLSIIGFVLHSRSISLASTTPRILTLLVFNSPFSTLSLAFHQDGRPQRSKIYRQGKRRESHPSTLSTSRRRAAPRSRSLHAFSIFFRILQTPHPLFFFIIAPPDTVESSRQTRSGQRQSTRGTKAAEPQGKIFINLQVAYLLTHCFRSPLQHTSSPEHASSP